MKFLVTVFILAIQTAAYAYLTPPAQVIPRPIVPALPRPVQMAPRMIPVQQLGAPLAASWINNNYIPRINSVYNLGFNSNLAPLLNPSLIPGLNSSFLSGGRPNVIQRFNTPLTPSYTSLVSPMYLPSYQPSYFPISTFSSFPNYGASYFPSSYASPYGGGSAFSTTRLSDAYGASERIPIRTAGAMDTVGSNAYYVPQSSTTSEGRREVIASATSTSDYTGGDRIALAGGGSETTYRTIRTPPSSAQPARTVQRPYGTSVSGRTRDERKAFNSPIWTPFIKRFKQCAPNCEPTGYAAEGSRSHASCHSGGHAIDVRGMYCHDTRRQYSTWDRWDRFQQMVECMKGKMLFWGWSGRRRVVRSGVIYRQSNPHPTLGHHDHVHFSLGCYDGHVW